VRRDIKIWILWLLIGLRDYSGAFDCQSKIKEVNSSLGLGAYVEDGDQFLTTSLLLLALQALQGPFGLQNPNWHWIVAAFTIVYFCALSGSEGAALITSGFGRSWRLLFWNWEVISFGFCIAAPSVAREVCLYFSLNSWYLCVPCLIAVLY
jgi:hypothetical protein